MIIENSGNESGNEDFIFEDMKSDVVVDEKATATTAQGDGDEGEAGALGDKAKADESKADEPSVDEEVDYSKIVLPEGFSIDEQMMSQATPLLKEIGVNKDNASKLFGMAAKLIENHTNKQMQAFNTQVEAWRQEASNDPILSKPENIAVANRAYKNFVPEKLEKLLEGFGLNNNPDMAHFFYEIGSKMGDDKLVLSSGGGTMPSNRDITGSPVLSFDDMKK